MRGPRSLLAALAAVAVLAGPVVGSAVAAADPPLIPQRPVAQVAAQVREAADPLALTIDSLSPAVLPRKGRVVLSGTITNTTDVTWTSINLYPLASDHQVMTTVAELDAAVEADPDLPVGNRILEVSQRIDSLAPGEVQPYRLSVPAPLLRAQTGEAPGVYWLGVHALGHSSEDEDDSSDGKARTFIPLLDDAKRAEDVALVLSVRRRVSHRPDGKIAGATGWSRDVDAGGRLRQVVDLAAAAGGRPLTWLVDPAVLDAVATLATGNAPRLAQAAPSSGTGSATPGPDATADKVDPPNQLAASWLESFRRLSTGDQVLSLPYGDVDASAASRLDPTTLVQARLAADTTVAALGITATAATASLNGYLEPAAIQSAAGQTVLIGSDALGIDGPAQVTVGSVPVLVGSSGAASGGPGPDDPLAATAMRQRIISEAAVRLLSGVDQPLVVVLPPTWRTGAPGEFFSGLDAPWLRFVTLRELPAPTQPVAIPADSLDYPAAQRQRELDAANFSAAHELADAGSLLAQLLAPDSHLEQRVAGEAYAGLSAWFRPTPNAARAATVRSTLAIRRTLSRITLETRPSLTLSGDSGIFPVGVHNGLDVPVTVQLAAESDGNVTISGLDQATIQPGQTHVARPTATVRRLGVHNVQLFLETPAGTRLPASVSLPVRRNQVSDVIWLIMGVGAAALFSAIGVRLFRRVRGRRGGVPEPVAEP